MSNAAPLLIGRRENQIILDKISHGPRPNDMPAQRSFVHQVFGLAA
jgi:hypothetical protein